jgi:prepilin-type N-terminal cleavage/methylation domain-containing protein
MKKQGGFTLVELMVVVSIAALLLAWGIPSFNTWNIKHGIEGQMVQLYSDLQFARMTGYGDKAASGVYWGTGAIIATSTSANPTSYFIRSDSSSNPVAMAIEQPPFITITATATKYPINVNVSANPKQILNSVSFDGRGFLLPAPNQTTAPSNVTFYVMSNSGAAIDCVAVTSTRITIGKMNAGLCAPK